VNSLIESNKQTNKTKESGAIFEAEKTGLIHFTSSAKARWDAEIGTTEYLI
jgi:uncharacterized protein YjdB